MKFKRFLAALLAVTTIFTAAGCGKESAENADAPDSSVSQETSTGTSADGEESVKTTTTKKKDKKSSKDKDKETTTEGADKDNDGDGEPAEGKVSSSEKKKMAAALQDMYKAALDGDGDKMLRCVFPDDLVKYMNSTYGTDLMTEGLLDDVPDFDISGIKVAKVEEVESDVVEGVGAYYNAMIVAFRELAKKGYDLRKLSDGGYSEEELEEIYNALSFMTEIEDVEDVEKIIDVTDVKIVTFTGLENGKDDEIFLYNVKGEGWKIDFIVSSMIGYVKKSKDQAANSYAKTISNAANSTAEEFDEMDIDVFGQCIICSDSSKTKMGSGCKIDENKFKENMGYFVDDLDEYKYFIVMDGGVCKYTVVEKSGTVGSYPAEKVITALEVSGAFEETDVSKLSFDQLYEMCAKLIK